jgi:XTP/dITP diphosphohydrolase
MADAQQSRQTWVLASGNTGKLDEFGKLFASYAITVVPQSRFAVPEAVEDGLSFIENAIIKARNACQYSGRPALADDSGLEVDALDGQPGIYSARFSADIHGAAANDQTNNEKLLALLERVPDRERSARFVCALAFMRHARDPVPVIRVGYWPGTIARAPCGENGFGYDPLFYLPELGCCSAQLDRQAKQQLSHRGQATRALIEQLKRAGRLPR